MKTNRTEQHSTELIKTRLYRSDLGQIRSDRQEDFESLSSWGAGSFDLRPGQPYRRCSSYVRL